MAVVTSVVVVVVVVVVLLLLLLMMMMMMMMMMITMVVVVVVAVVIQDGFPHWHEGYLLSNNATVEMCNVTMFYGPIQGPINNTQVRCYWSDQ